MYTVKFSCFSASLFLILSAFFTGIMGNLKGANSKAKNRNITMLYNDSANSFSQSAIPLTFNSQSKTNWDANWVKGAFLVSDCNTFHIENALKWHKLPKTYRLNDIKMTKKILSKENAWNGYLEQFP